MSESKPRLHKFVTIKDVAAYAGVSPKTVSNAVNDWPYMREETRQKVKEAIRALGYRPSHLARGLVTGRTGTIGLVLPDISNPFFGSAVRGIEDVLYHAGYSIYLCNTDEDLHKEQSYLDKLFGQGVDALIVWGSRLNSSELFNHISNDLPLVMVDCVTQEGGFNHTSLTVDSLGGAEVATAHLIRQGHRQIAHLAGPSQRPTAGLRIQGYRQALQAAGIPFDFKLVVEGKPTIRGGYNAACQLLEHQKPAALFCYNDLMAIGAMAAAQQYELNIPHELALVGFDDIVLASLVEPALTTMRIAQYDLGKLVGELLLERLHNQEKPTKNVLYPTELVVRGSCGAKRFSRKQKQTLLQNLVDTVSVDLPN
jgi:LacI family transcriptional regulator